MEDLDTTVSLQRWSSSSKGGFCWQSIIVLAETKDWATECFKLPGTSWIGPSWLRPEQPPEQLVVQKVQSTCWLSIASVWRAASLAVPNTIYWTFYWIGPFVVQQVWIKYQSCNLCWQGSTYAAGEEGAASVPSCIDWVFKRRAP